ncbi:MAG: hypothetical protein JWQ95_6430 [Sphaerisporangium sp.]|nr:hypothetical protein [Sphaerisporangium sp.]
MILKNAALVLAGGALLCGCDGGAALGPVQFDELRSQGVASDLVYVVDLPGYELAKQSVSVYNDEGFQAFYFSPEGAEVWFGAERGAFSDVACLGKPVHDAEPATAPVSCESDDVGWYRTSGLQHEYAVVQDAHLIRLGGRQADVDREALKDAMAGVRHAAG